MTASPRRSRQIGAGIHSSGGNNGLSNNSNNPNIPLASGSDYPPCPARLFNKLSPNGPVRRSRMSLGVFASGVALVLMVVSCAVGTFVFGDLAGAQQVQMKLLQEMQENQPAETQQQMQQLRSTMDANAAVAAAADAQPNDMTVSDLAAHVSSEVETLVEALKTQLAGYAASAAAEAVRENWPMRSRFRHGDPSNRPSRMSIRPLPKEVNHQHYIRDIIAHLKNTRLFIEEN
jgi:hypothetical protein